MRTVGVEEELLLVDAGSGDPRALSTAVLALAERRAEGDSVFESELHDQQLEFATEPRTAMADLAEEIRRWRAEAAHSAAEAGAAVAALATSPLPVSPAIGEDERHRWLARRFGLTAQEQLTCGCHVHVSVESDEEGVAVLDRVRPWLPVLLALSGNSPFWQGQDTSYDSYRSRVWGRWPSAVLGGTVRLGGAVPPAGGGADRHGSPAGQGNDLLRRTALAPLPHGGVQGGGRLPGSGRHRAARHARTWPGRDGGTRLAGRLADRIRSPRVCCAWPTGRRPAPAWRDG